MAYNPMMYSPYGNTYGNSYNQPYQQTMPQLQQASYASSGQGMVWVDGETEAKGKQMPYGASQFAMWDINEPVIYIKSLNQMGIPNPLRKIRYQMEELPMEQGGNKKLVSGEEEKDGTAQYARKDELQTMKEEIMQAIREIKSDNASSARRTTKGE